MWAEEGRTGSCQGAQPLQYLPCLQKPRSYQGQSLILDSGSMCRKGHSLLLHSPAGKPRHVPTWDSSASPKTQTHLGFSQGLSLLCSKEGQVVLVSSPGLANPETHGRLYESLFPDLYMRCEGLSLVCVHAVMRVNNTNRAGYRVYTHQIPHGSISHLKGVFWTPLCAQICKHTR